MHEMQTTVTNVRSVCLSVCLSRGSTVCGADSVAISTWSQFQYTTDCGIKHSMLFM